MDSNVRNNSTMNPLIPGSTLDILHHVSIMENRIKKNMINFTHKCHIMT